MYLRWLVLGACLAGCGRVGFTPVAGDPVDARATAAPPPPFVHGSRLRAVRMAAGDGELFRTWHDTVLNVECQFQRTADGIRCIPIFPYVSGFSDPGCTVPVAAMFTSSIGCGGVATTYASTSSLTGDAIATPYVVSGVHAGAVYVGSPGSCGAITPGTSTHFTLAGPAPLETFVPAHTELTRHGDLSYVEVVADDGARQLLPESVDHLRGDVPCRWSLYEPEVGTHFCVSAGVAVGGRAFSDPQCSRQLVVETQPLATYFQLTAPSACSEHFRIVERGAAYSGPLYQPDATGACVALASAGAPVFEAGTDRTAEFPRAVRRVGEGTSRIRSLSWETADGFIVPDTFYLWDTGIGAKCQVKTDNATGRAFCAPIWSQQQAQIFSDASCTQQLIGMMDCREREGAIYFPDLGSPPSSCEGGEAQRIFTFSVPNALTTAYERRPDVGCVPVDLTGTPLRQMAAVELDATPYVSIETRR